MIKSYKDALLSTSSQTEAVMVKDARAIFNKSHEFFDKFSYQCATLILLIEFCKKHAKYIINERLTALLHETLYKKLVEFQNQLNVQFQKSTECFCLRNLRNYKLSHSPAIYLRCLTTLLKLFKQPHGTLLPVFLFLNKKMPTDIVKNIFSFITLIPL